LDERAGPSEERNIRRKYEWKKGDTALFLAAEQGEKKSITALLQAGADPFIRNAENETPIHRLVCSLKILLERQSIPQSLKVRLRSQGISPKNGRNGLVQVGEYFATSLSAMLYHSSPGLVNAQDAEGRTPLMLLLTCGGQSDKVEAGALVPPATALLRGGADVSLVDANGQRVEEFIESKLVKKAYLNMIAQFTRHLKGAKRSSKAGSTGKKRRVDEEGIATGAAARGQDDQDGDGDTTAYYRTRSGRRLRRV